MQIYYTPGVVNQLNIDIKINWFNQYQYPIAIDWCRQSITIKITETFPYRLAKINNNPQNLSWWISIVMDRKKIDDNDLDNSQMTLWLCKIILGTTQDRSSSLASVAWRFLSNLSALRKRGSHQKERQGREEPGIESGFAARFWAGRKKAQKVADSYRREFRTISFEI